MLVGEMKDLARQIAERQVPLPLWLAALRSAISAAGRYDERLELFVLEPLTLPANTQQIAVPAGYETSQLLGVQKVEGGGRQTRLLRWRLTDDQAREEQFTGREEPQWNLTWDAPSLGFLVFTPAQSADTELLLTFRSVPNAEDDEVPEWLLYGALSWLGKNLLRDPRVEDWQAQFLMDLDGAVAQQITASSMPIRLPG
jgi:hypothetical protein